MGMVAGGRSSPVVAHLPVQEWSRPAMGPTVAPAWCCSVVLGRPLDNPQRGLV